MDESLSGAAWEILYNAINKTIARVQVWNHGRMGWTKAAAGGVRGVFECRAPCSLGGRCAAPAGISRGAAW